MVRHSAEFGERLKRRRQIVYASQQDFADALTALRGNGKQVSRDSVSKWETGQHYPARMIGLIEHLLGPLDDSGQPLRRVPPHTRRILRAALPDDDDYERVIALLERDEDAGGRGAQAG